MAASSVTGTGPGESNGLYKIQNNGSCGCSSPSTPPQPKPKKKIGCFVSYRSGGVLSHGFKNRHTSEKSCF